MRLLGPLVLCAGCAVAPKAHQAADVSGFKAEIAAVQSHIRDIETDLEVTTDVAVALQSTSNYTADVWFNRGILIVAGVLGWLRLRTGKREAAEELDAAYYRAKEHATCEAKKHGYKEQRQARLKQEGLEGIGAGA